MSTLTPAELRSVASNADKLTRALVKTYVSEEGLLVARVRAVGDAQAAHDSIAPNGPKLSYSKVIDKVGEALARRVMPEPTVDSPAHAEWADVFPFAAASLAPSKATVGNYGLTLGFIDRAGVSRSDAAILAVVRVLSNSKTRATLPGIVGEALTVTVGEERDAAFIAAVNGARVDYARNKLEAAEAARVEREQAAESAALAGTPEAPSGTVTGPLTASALIAILDHAATDGAYSDDEQDAINSAMSRLFDSFAPVAVDSLVSA